MEKELRKTSDQELQEVIDGKKPAALGYWPELPKEVLSQKLLAVYGRFYDMAIAMTDDKLNSVVRAYYIPISREGDVRLGKALGYKDEDILKYTAGQFYPKFNETTKEQRTEMKVFAVVQKLGLEKALEEVYAYLEGDELVKHVCDKEGMDMQLAIKILLRIKRGELKCYLGKY